MGAITQTGILFAEPYNKPLSTAGQFQPGCYLVFMSGGIVVPVYRDPQLLWPHNQTSIPGYGPPSKYAITSGVVADGTGRFPPIYLDPAISYSYTLYSAAGTVLETGTNITSSDTTQTGEAVKPFLTSIGSGTVPIIDPALQLPLTPGTWRIEANLSFADSNSSAFGLQVGVYYSGTLNAGAINAFTIYGLMNDASVVNGSLTVNTAVPFATIDATSTFNILNVAGTIQVSTAGVLSIKWSYDTAGNSILSMPPGSALYAQKLA